MPQALKERPALGPGLSLYMDAFKELSECRQTGLAEQALTTSDIYHYAQIQGFCQNELPFFFKAMRTLDKEFMIYRSEQRQKESQRQKNSSGGRNPRPRPARRRR